MQTMYNMHSKFKYRVLPEAYLNINLFFIKWIFTISNVAAMKSVSAWSIFFVDRKASDSIYFWIHNQLSACMQNILKLHLFISYQFWSLIESGCFLSNISEICMLRATRKNVLFWLVSEYHHCFFKFMCKNENIVSEIAKGLIRFI